MKAFLVFMLFCQASGRFEEAKRLGMAYVEDGQFDKAAARLEEIWEQDRSDAAVAEYLAMAYLNTEDRSNLKRNEELAFQLIEQSMRMQGRASFLVQHSHERMVWLQGRELNQYCSGRISIIGKNLIFEGVAGEKAKAHSFSVPLSQVSVEYREKNEKGVFQLFANRNAYTFVTRNRNARESSFLVRLIQSARTAP